MGVTVRRPRPWSLSMWSVMITIRHAFWFFLATSLGLACVASALKTGGPGTGTRSGPDASGEVIDFGGSISGGIAGSGDTGGYLNFGGSLAGGSSGAGGALGSGGQVQGGVDVGGSSVGGVGGVSGAGGAICPHSCAEVACLNGSLLVPSSDPCGCLNCSPPDAGGAWDACLALPCAAPVCPAGYQVVTTLCGCPTCVPPPDAAAPDTGTCPPINCPALGCVMSSSPAQPCGCPICSADAGPVTKVDVMPATDAGAPCVVDADCTAKGLRCGYPVADGCSATGTCVSPPKASPCWAIVVESGCGCDGATVSWSGGCQPELPDGYAPAAISHTGACP